MSAERLFDPIRIHCVFCPHVVESFADYMAAHREMDRHHREKHARTLRNIVGPITIGTNT